MTTIKVYLGILDKVAPDMAGTSYPITITSFCLAGRTDKMEKYHQDFLLTTLYKLDPRNLLGVLIRILENMMTSMKPYYVQSLTASLFKECVDTIHKAVCTLRDNIYDLVRQHIFISSARMRVKYDDQDEEMEYHEIFPSPKI
jgi:hypothetical protein